MSNEKPPRHARPSQTQPTPAGEEPSHAERARTLVDKVRTGALSTISKRHADWPFGSVMPYGLDGEGCPTFLISNMAMHTQNLLAEPRASLLVMAPETAEDPLGAGRVTLMGEVRKIEEERLADLKKDYLTRHPNASYWVDFGDFGFFRMDVMDLYFVGGFGVMGWVTGDDYRSAEPDPLAPVASGIIEHMNEDHVDALLLLADGLGGIQGEDAKMTSVDRLGFHARIKTPDGVRGLRIPFPREARTGEEVRKVLVEMVKDQRGGS